MTLSFRKERVSDLLKEFLAEQLSQLGDPRVKAITITDVAISPDLKNAKVYWTALGRNSVTGEYQSDVFPTDTEIADFEACLRSVSKLLQARIGKELKLRYTPHLRFYYDQSVKVGFQMDQLIKKATTGQS